jgi:glyoxylase-like metal-dependent hydrolase (beta-lactamase superfamily II)
VIAPMRDRGVGPAPVPGRLDQLAPGLHRLTAPNPGLMTGPGTNTYLVGERSLAVIDPGPDDADHRAAILTAASNLGAIRWVLVTHTHRDHAPGAAALAAATGAEVIGFGPAEGFEPDRSVGDGWRLDPPAAAHPELAAVHTPGHASDHLCWLLPDLGILLTGDHVMHGSTVVIRPPDGDVREYVASLGKVRSLGPAVRTLAPGHGRLMEPVEEVIDDLLAHRRARHELVAAAMARLGEGGVDDLLPLVYDDVTEPQLPVARFSLWAHLRALAGEGRIVASGDGDGELGDGDGTIETRWRVVVPEGAAAGPVPVQPG